MTTEDEKFLKRLMATFKIEAEEHLKTMSSLLQFLERPHQAQQTPQLVESLFREAHSLKGAARSVNLGAVESVCQVLESVLAKLKRGEITLSQQFFDTCFRTIDQLASNVDAGIMGQNSAPAQPTEIIRALDRVLTGAADVAKVADVADVAVQPEHQTPAVLIQESATASIAPGAESGATETVRISTGKLGNLLVQIEELSAFKFSSQHLVNELRSAKKLLAQRVGQGRGLAREDSLLRSSLYRAPRSIPSKERGRHQISGVWAEKISEATTEDQHFTQVLVDRLHQLERQTELDRRLLSTQLDGLMQDMKQALMLPFSTLLDMTPKLVRDLAHDSGKDVELTMLGTSIEIDRRILEQIKAPLVHLIRNAVDHGLEAPAVRQARNKPGRGRIMLEVIPRDGNKIELTIADDGAGLDLAQIKANAVKLGIVQPDSLARMEKREAMALIFESGLSTSAMLTDVSGRGLGLAIVREKVEKLGGSVEVDELGGQLPGGTRFRIVLPSTLAAFRGLLVEVVDQRFVLPSINVERVTRVPRESIRTVANRETIELDGLAVSLVSLAETLQLNSVMPAGESKDYQPVAILVAAGKRIAFSVDAILGDQEVLVKKLGPQLLRVPNIAGVTVLDRGRLVPILNVSDLLRSALKVKGSTHQAEIEKPLQSILVVEDSITSRSLIKAILEAAGYRVSAAVDGIDGLTTLRSGHFDLVVSDVEMPRMDGFELTARIRSDRKFAELPVILVTALDSREHKEQGIEVGANAYIVKSSFDQSNLLDAIRRLI